MSVEENIGFIKAQLDVFQTMRSESERVVMALQQQGRATQAEANAARDRIRALRQSLVSDGRLPSLEAVEERLRLQRQVRDAKRAAGLIEEKLAKFSDLAQAWNTIQQELRTLPQGDVSSTDKAKLSDLQALFVAQLQQYGLTSVDPKTLEISADSYKPIREGFDIDFNNSASDLVRTHWAYLAAFLELARVHKTNHPGLLIMDEPGQQSTDWESLRAFLMRLASAGKHSQQVIVATSEVAERIEPALKHVDHHYLPFDGRILTPLTG